MRALLDQRHPKRTMWLSVGTELPARHPPPLSLAAGHFWGSEADCARLQAAPTDETLAELLGYVEPKTAIHAPYVIVQARDPTDCVISEQLVSRARLPEALARLAGWGSIHVLHEAQVISRRLVLREKESAHVLV